MRWILATLMLLAVDAAADVIVRDHAEQTVVRYDRSYALLIGVSHYTAGWRDLPSIPAELAQVESVLGEQGFEITKVLDPTEDELRQAFERFIDAHGYAESHRLLVYYAGHGYSRKLAVGLRGYLVPADAPRPTEDLDGFLGKAVPMVDVETWARRIEAKHALFVFDSCFSGSVFDSRGELPQPASITSKMGRSVREFLTAGSAGEEVPAKSVFTPAFVRGLRGDADLTRDGYITGTELGVYLDQSVRYPGQTPQFCRLRGYNEGDFVFRLNPEATPPLVEFNLEDLRAQAERESLWVKYQRRMDAAFKDVEKLDAGDAMPLTKTEAWQRFLETFKRDNPLSTDDDRFRKVASDRAGYWRTQGLSIPPPIDLPERSTELEAGAEWTDPAIGMKFRYIPAGTFLMGSPEDEPGRDHGETRHEVTLTHGYWMGKTEVTQAQWRAVMGNNPSHFKSCGDDCPAESVNWFEAVAYANALSERAGFSPCYRVSGPNAKKAGKGLEYDTVEWVSGCAGYRLPTEAEWERAARAGSSTALYTGKLTIRGLYSGPELDPIAWYGGNSGVSYSVGVDCSDWKEKQYPDLRTCGPHSVGEKQPNRWGLHDTLGNVWEWMWDLFGSYQERKQVDPIGSEGGAERVIRGGSWLDYARHVRAAYRIRYPPGERSDALGFRVSRGQEAEPGGRPGASNAGRLTGGLHVSPMGRGEAGSRPRQGSLHGRQAGNRATARHRPRS